MMGVAIAVATLGAANARKLTHEHKVRKMQRKIAREERKEKRRKLELKLSPEQKKVLEQIESTVLHEQAVESKRSCPECQKKMVLITVGDIEIDFCKFCKGCWFDPGELTLFTKKDSDIPGENLHSRKSRYNCPDCGDEMQEYVFIKSNNLLVDKCENQHGIYLENGEFERCIALS